MNLNKLKMDRRTSDNESLSCAEKLIENSDGQFKGANSTKVSMKKFLK